MKKLLYLLLLFAAFKAVAQKLPFENYGVDKGLVQSQVQAFTQDQQHHLWVATYGGLDRFDGSSFTHFTLPAGFFSGGITSLYTARNGSIWFSGFKGIGSYDGKKISTYPYPSNGFTATVITQDNKGTIWVFGFAPRLLQLIGDTLQPAPLPFEGATPTCLFKDASGKLIASFYQKGLYAFSGNAWQKINDAQFISANEFIAGGVPAGDALIFVSSQKKIYRLSADGKVITGSTHTQKIGAINLVHDALWLGTANGIHVYDASTLQLKKTMGTTAGLSDNLVNDIYQDADGNTWIGTDGDGLFRYSGGSFRKFDRTNGLTGNVVMGIVKIPGGMAIGCREKGWVQYNSADQLLHALPGPDVLDKTGINCMAADAYGNVYIGTIDNRLFKYYQGQYTQIKVLPPNVTVNSIACRKDKIWIASPLGYYTIQNNRATRISNLNAIGLSILPTGDSTALATTVSGLYEIKGSTARKTNDALLANIEINCINTYHEYYLLGTLDKGLCIWDKQSSRKFFCNTTNGLADNMVFSAFTDADNNIWVGTATSIHKILFNETTHTFTVTRFSKADGYEPTECNLNTLVADNEGNIWIGTTKGAFIYQENKKAVTAAVPYTVIQSVHFPGDTLTKENALSAWYSFPENPVISYHNNSISFTVKGILLKNPGDILYSSMLSGYDTGFSLPSAAAFFNYRNLEPGDYVFKVRTVTSSGILGNTISYHFTITAPFYKTRWFYVLLSLVLIFTGVLIQRIISRFNTLRQQRMEQQRLEDINRLREQTAEDFHDELGNKLTRIALLADILKRKTPATENDKINIIQQVQENVQALYNGTKDIIWSLTPAGDDLRSVLNRIRQFGNELFNESDIVFTSSGIDEMENNILLSPDLSRNLIMIAKEILNNTLRHSGGSSAGFSARQDESGNIILVFADNGKGIGQYALHQGNGLKNIRKRAERINAGLTVDTSNGTTITIKLKIPPKG